MMVPLASKIEARDEVRLYESAANDINANWLSLFRATVNGSVSCEVAKVRLSTIKGLCRSQKRITLSECTLNKVESTMCDVRKCKVESLTASKIIATESTIGELKIVAKGPESTVNLSRTTIERKITIEADPAISQPVHIRFIGGTIPEGEVHFIGCSGTYDCSRENPRL